MLLLAQTPLQQVLRLPILLEHYREHRADNKHLGLSAFIFLHYIGGHPKDADHDRDGQLPFLDKSEVLMSSTVVVPAQVVADFAPPVYEEHPYVPLCLTHLLPRHASDIFQPPRA